ncbi:MAG: PilZ domain-containing protein [Elusimicrobiaceae bacterium]|nr:PilZ domain-containing protein [Elusimicrobiaceae bacterium]
MEKESKFQERRKHVRLPIIHGVVEPVNLAFEDSSGNMITQPAILSNLSSGGMRLMTFLDPPKGNLLDMSLELPGLGKIPVQGRIAWVRGKGGVFMTGIAFTEIGKTAVARINAMAEDYEDCETRVTLKLPEACVGNCKCHYLCNKPQKDETLFETRPARPAGKKTGSGSPKKK